MNGDTAADEPQDATEGEGTSLPLIGSGVIMLLGAAVIAVACWFGALAVWSLVLGLFPDIGENDSGLFGFFYGSIYRLIQVLVAAMAWLSVWLFGVLVITTWHRFVRRPRR